MNTDEFEAVSLILKAILAEIEHLKTKSINLNGVNSLHSKVKELERHQTNSATAIAMNIKSIIK